MNGLRKETVLGVVLAGLVTLGLSGCSTNRGAGTNAATPLPAGAAAAAAAVPASSPEEIEKEVLAQGARRMEAMVKGDLAVLQEILRDDLSYVHSSGPLETKAQFLDEIATRKLVYRGILPSDQKVRVYGDTAVVTGVAQLKVTSGRQALSFYVRFTEVWVRTGNAWKLAAWQSTRLSD